MQNTKVLMDEDKKSQIMLYKNSWKQILSKQSQVHRNQHARSKKKKTPTEEEKTIMIMIWKGILFTTNTLLTNFDLYSKAKSKSFYRYNIRKN